MPDPTDLQSSDRNGELRREVMFRCPTCHGSLNYRTLNAESTCSNCGVKIQVVEGVPILVRDQTLIESIISTARQDGREAWFCDEQIGQWMGPYRHHVLKRKKWVEQALDRYIAESNVKSGVGLDLGCGDGSNLAWLRPIFGELYASDYNFLRLLRAKRLGVDASIFMADISDYPVNDNSFDIIYFNHVLEHIPDDVRALQEVYRILRPGGLLVLGVPNEGAAFWQLAYRLQPQVLRSSDHLHHYTAETITSKCRETGFLIRQVHPLGWGVPHWTLDAIIRQWKSVDDIFEVIGRRIIPSQATSLYLLLTK
jgi:SAM-dependent methyltransferase/uncharacterized protein YbaR (Trm112 family)